MNDQKTYDLEERTFKFAKDVRIFLRGLKKDFIDMDDFRQLARSSGSVGANYIEANEALGKKDFVMRIRISRKEAKESIYWLKLFNAFDDDLVENERKRLIQEGTELMKIFSAIMRKSE